MPRFFSLQALAQDAELQLDDAAARHVQVLRLQPGSGIDLFDGLGGEFSATVLQMGKRHVSVRVGQRNPVEREALVRVHLLVGLMASERMDWLVEKATELGAVRITPVLAERSMLKLTGERADKKRQHWQGVAVAACEQCGRNRVPTIDLPQPLAQALTLVQSQRRVVLGFGADAMPLQAAALGADVAVLSGPEGGLSAAEEALALASGFAKTQLGARVLRAETAPLAVLSALTLA
jgi:16S rRNA (uracil1498-N3)-methyltransferase